LQPQVRIYTPSTPGALRQGEIVTGLIQLRVELASIATADEGAVIQPIVHPFAIVMSQDCDLDRDFRARQQQAGQEKLLPNVFLPGNHRGRAADSISRDEQRRLGAGQNQQRREVSAYIPHNSLGIFP
jgi:hypothetical protein